MSVVSCPLQYLLSIPLFFFHSHNFGFCTMKRRLGKPFFTCSHHMSRPSTFSSLWYDLRCFHAQDLTDEPKLLSQCQFPLGENPWESEAVCVTRMNKHRAKNCNNGLFRGLWQNKKMKRSNTSTSIETTLSIFYIVIFRHCRRGPTLMAAFYLYYCCCCYYYCCNMSAVSCS